MTEDRSKNDLGPDSRSKALRDRVKWVTFCVSASCFFAALLRGYMYSNYDVHPEQQTATTEFLSKGSSFLLTLALLATVTLAILTLPRWQGFFAFVIVLVTIWIGMSA